MADWDGLENRSGCKPTVGSNPTPSVASLEDVIPPESIMSRPDPSPPVGNWWTRGLLIGPSVPVAASVLPSAWPSK